MNEWLAYFNDLNPATIKTIAILVLIVGVIGLTLVLLVRHRQIKHHLKHPSQPPHSLDWHTLAINEVFKRLDVSDQGLSKKSADERLIKFGPNQLTEAPPTSIGYLLLSQFKNFLIVILIFAAMLAAAMGDIRDGLVILTVVLINAFLGFYQEYRAEKSLAALKKMLALKAKVKRDGHIQELFVTQLVPGDLVILEAGDKLPADGLIVHAHSLEIDESSLTGESIPVTKQAGKLEKKDCPLSEQNNRLFMNTVVTHGRAEMVVTETGMQTEIGRIAGLLAAPSESSTPLQVQLDSLGKRLAFIAFVIILLLFASALLRGEPLIKTAFTAIALAVAAIPEGLPAVVTVTLALGMHRMARQKAIVKRLAAVETLGCTTVICSDKTGTLTHNQMTVRAIHYQDKHFGVSGQGYSLTGEIKLDSDCVPIDFAPLLNALVLCNDSQLREGQVIGDPMEAALLVLAAKGGLDSAAVKSQFKRLAEIPFDATNKFMATFHEQGERVVVFIKGAPEILLSHCTYQLNGSGSNNPVEHVKIINANERMAATGLRILAVAMADIAAEDFNPKGDLLSHINNLGFIALIGLMDPPRQEAREAIALCRKAGIRVKMITGDQKVTATAIADELGLSGNVMDGDELAKLDNQALAEQIEHIAVFARTAPEQKVRIVTALQENGEVVAMTGDGVNDAPALKHADIGVAMGISGTDVARESASMILTDDNFATIVRAVQEGRSLYENMIKFIRYQLSTNIGAILTVAAAPLLSLPVPFSAIQLLWINIIMDGPPAIALGIDPSRPACMNEPPRPPKSRILSLPRFGNLFSYGLTMACGTLGILAYSLQNGDKNHAITLAFTTFVLFQIFNVFNARSEKRSAFNRQFFMNHMLWLALVCVVLLQILVVHWPPAQLIFHTVPLTLNDWLLGTGIAASVLLLEETRKLLQRCVSAIVKCKPKKST
jgi:P-type Ca2+ transporter type 2C